MKRVALWTAAAGLVGVLVFSAVAYGLSWLGRTGEVVSVENYEEQYGQLWEDWESLRKSAGDVCSAEEALQDAIDRGADDRTVTQRETQTMTYGQVYRQIQADYDARMANYFETLEGFVAPPELPDKAPTLEESKATC